jgi:hypothetical protein
MQPDGYVPISGRESRKELAGRNGNYFEHNFILLEQFGVKYTLKLRSHTFSNYEYLLAGSTGLAYVLVTSSYWRSVFYILSRAN